MGQLVSKYYIDSNYILRKGYFNCGYGCSYYDYNPMCTPCGATESDTMLAWKSWIEEWYFCKVNGVNNGNRLPDISELQELGIYSINWTFNKTGAGGQLLIYKNNTLITTINSSGTGVVEDFNNGDTLKIEVYPGNQNYSHITINGTEVANSGAEPEYSTYTMILRDSVTLVAATDNVTPPTPTPTPTPTPSQYYVYVYNTYSSTQNGWIISDVTVNGTSLSSKVGFPISRGGSGSGICTASGSNNTVVVFYSQVDNTDVGRIVANSTCQNINGTETSTTVSGVTINSNIDVNLDWDSTCP